jgi:RNA polymerase sigma-70 factor (ECF subfamily)
MNTPHPRDKEFLRCLADLRRWCARRSGDPHLADDAVQETALHALRQMPFLREPERMRGWLFRILQRRLADLSRDRPPWLSLTIDPVASRPPGPDPEVLRLIRRAMRTLPACLRKPVRLHYLEGRPIREVAASLHTTVNGVKARLYRARRILRERTNGGSGG